MRSKLLYLAVPLFTFLAFYRFWNMGPTLSTTSKEPVSNKVTFTNQAALSSMDLVTYEKNPNTRQSHAQALRDGE